MNINEIKDALNIVLDITMEKGVPPTVKTTIGDNDTIMNGWLFSVKDVDKVEVAEVQTVQVYVCDSTLRAYVYPDLHMSYSGDEWHEAIKLYDTYYGNNSTKTTKENEVCVIRSYVGQPMVDDECKETTLLRGTMINDVLMDVTYKDNTRMDEALWYLDNDIVVEVNDKNVDTLVKCGYAIAGNAATRVKKLSVFVLTVNLVIRGVVMCDSRYEAEILLGQLKLGELNGTIAELSEGDLMGG